MADDRPVLWLHVGTHKTGTTSIQRMILDHRETFTTHGVVPWLENESANAFALAHEIIRPWLQTPMRLLGKIADRAARLEALGGWASGLGRPAALISSESFCFLRTQEERMALVTILGQHFSEIRPILALRRDQGWRQSWRAQICRAGLLDRIEAQPEGERVTAEWYFDRRAIIAFWDSVGPMTRIDYDIELAAHGSILPAFLKAVGLADADCKRNYWLNKTLVQVIDG